MLSSFGHRDFTANSAAFDVSLIHRFGEHRRNNELAAVSRLNLIINLENVFARRPEKQRAVFANIDVIDAVDG